MPSVPCRPGQDTGRAGAAAAAARDAARRWPLGVRAPAQVLPVSSRGGGRSRGGGADASGQARGREDRVLGIRGLGTLGRLSWSYWSYFLLSMFVMSSRSHGDGGDLTKMTDTTAAPYVGGTAAPLCRMGSSSSVYILLRAFVY